MTKLERFRPTLFEFLEQLADNNNRPWFLENKGRYEQEVLGPAMALIRAFQPRLKRISQFFLASDRRVGGSLMRVYRDTRFAKDGAPYKTNVGIQFRHEQGRDVHAPGFYVHIAPGECFLAVGLWRPEPEPLGRVRQAIGAMAVTMGGVDALVFTAGVGEHSAEVRQTICDGLECLGLELDPAANGTCRPDVDVARHGSRGRILVIATREDLTMLREVLRVLHSNSHRGDTP